MRIRKVVARGTNSFGIALLKADMKDFELKIGSNVDIDDIHLVKKASKKEK